MNTVERVRQTINQFGKWSDVPVKTEDLEALCAVVEAAQNVEVISGGSGPAAPIFDEFDAAVERNRGSWYTVDGKKFDKLKEALKKVC